MVIGDRAVAQKDLVDQFLAVEEVLQRLAHFQAVIRRSARQHRESVVLVARHFEDLGVRVRLDQLLGLEVHAVDRIDLIGHQRIGPRLGVVHRDLFDAVEMALGVVVVVAKARHQRAYAGIEGFDLVGAGADALGDGFFNPARRMDQDVIVRQQEREVGVAGFQRHRDLMIVLLFDFLNGGDNWLGRRFCVFRRVQRQ